MQAQGGVEVFSETITHVATGKNLSSIIANDLLGEMYSSGELASLTKAGKDNLIANIVTRLTPEQLQNIGLSSGDIKVIKPGEYLDIKKLAEFAKDLKITLGGKEMSLLERALTIK
jgi:hypothetical protein